MGCNVWTSTTVIAGGNNDLAGHRKTQVQRADGTGRELRPRHLVFANGTVGGPRKAKARVSKTSQAKFSTPTATVKDGHGAKGWPGAWCGHQRP